MTDDVPEQIFQEEVAEVLAATWKDKRQELNRLHRSRRFAQAREVKRSFKVEVEELKKRTQCHRCGRTGHWARERKLPRSNQAGSASDGAATASSALGASMVQAQGQHFVCYVSAVVPPEQGKPTMLQVLRDRLRRGPEEALLVSSPGYAALDSGCGRSIVGEETLAQFRRLWTKAGIDQPRPSAERNTCRFGNGHEEVTNKVVEMPITVAGRRGAVRAAVIKGQAPLLLSRAVLKRLKAQMDFDADELMIFESKTPVRMMTNEAGQYIRSPSPHSPFPSRLRGLLNVCRASIRLVAKGVYYQPDEGARKNKNKRRPINQEIHRLLRKRFGQQWPKT